MAQTATPQGMCFVLDRFGIPQPEPSLNNGAPWNDSPSTADFSICVTGVPASTSVTAVQAALANFCSLPLPFSSLSWSQTGAPIAGNGPIRFFVAWSSIGSNIPTTASRW